MPSRIMVFMACVLGGCRPTLTPSSPEHQVPAATNAAEPEPATQGIADERRLPALPPDMVATLSAAHEAVQACHAAPMPTLHEPLATKAEHQEWVDRELEPWREGVREVVLALDQSKPVTPHLDADEAEWAAFERVQIVYSALVATARLDERLVQVSIPWPLELWQDPSDRVALEEYAMVTLAEAIETSEMWRGMCTTYAGDQPLPEDVGPWVRHCNAMADAVVEAVCKAEQDVGLSASVPCSGDRLLRESPPLGEATVLSMEQLMQIVEQSLVLCDLAEDIIDDPKIEPKRRVQAWQSRLDAEGIRHPALITLVDEVVGADDRSIAATKLATGIESILRSDWECSAFEPLFEG